MKKSVKILVCCLLVALIVAASVLGTLAYLTASDTVTNTFTVGQVDIKLDEAKVDEEGKAVAGADRVQTNAYHLLPGLTYAKDPMVTVQPNSEESYIRMILTVHNASAVQSIITKHNLTDFADLIGGWDQTVWLYEGYTADDEKNTISFEFRHYQKVVTEDDPLPLAPLFTTLIVPGTVTGTEMSSLYAGGFKMVVTGHAIQADGFDSEAAAWAAFDAQHSN